MMKDGSCEPKATEGQHAKARRLPRHVVDAHRWFLDHGGDGAVARGRYGGRLYLFQGERAPFMPVTVYQLIAAGLAEYYGDKPKLRLRVFAASREPSLSPPEKP